MAKLLSKRHQYRIICTARALKMPERLPTPARKYGGVDYDKHWGTTVHLIDDGADTK